jgi:hypothetical protein
MSSRTWSATGCPRSAGSRSRPGCCTTSAGLHGETFEAATLEVRLARDALWDSEIARQAEETGLPVLHVDGSRTVEASPASSPSASS